MAQDADNSKNKVHHRFDKILIKHLERLIGSSHLFSELALNTVIISCLIIMIERENEIDSVPSHSPARYTCETLISELEKMGFEPDRNINIVVREMIEKGYINVEEEYLIPEEPTTAMVKLLDRTFPGMPGMNLVAYFIQTMDEVNWGRKDLDSALSQFDQILNMQGVPLNKEQSDSEPAKVPEPSEGQETQIKKSDILGRQKIGNWNKDSRVSPSAPKVLSLDTYEGKLRKLDFGKSFPEEGEIDKITPDKASHIESERPESRVKAVETKPHDDIESENIDALSEAPSEQLTETDRDVQSLTEEITDTKKKVGANIQKASFFSRL